MEEDSKGAAINDFRLDPYVFRTASKDLDLKSTDPFANEQPHRVPRYFERESNSNPKSSLEEARLDQGTSPVCESTLSDDSKST